MTPAGFDYLQPTSIMEALEMVNLHQDATFLAGGHALLPDSTLPESHRRHPLPSTLIDLGRIAELRGIEILQDAGVAARGRPRRSGPAGAHLAERAHRRGPRVALAGP